MSPRPGSIRSLRRGSIRRFDGLSQSFGITFVVVTHELASIFAIADRCIMLDAQAQDHRRRRLTRGPPRPLRRPLCAAVLPAAGRASGRDRSRKRGRMSAKSEPRADRDLRRERDRRPGGRSFLLRHPECVRADVSPGDLRIGRCRGPVQRIRRQAARGRRRQGDGDRIQLEALWRHASPVRGRPVHDDAGNHAGVRRRRPRGRVAPVRRERISRDSSGGGNHRNEHRGAADARPEAVSATRRALEASVLSTSPPPPASSARSSHPSTGPSPISRRSTSRRSEPAPTARSTPPTRPSGSSASWTLRESRATSTGLRGMPAMRSESTGASPATRGGRSRRCSSRRSGPTRTDS